jgi:beta-glucosidase
MKEKPLYLDCTKSFEERVEDLVSRLSLKEKILHLTYKAPGNKKLGINPYDWWNECLHGVARAGIATVFPQSIGLGATFDEDLIYKIADIISTEARAKHHEFQRKKDFGRYKGLTFWSPNINIFRDPRWGRGQETYGECPYLTSRLGVAFIKGLQGDHPKYLKVVATSKHFAVHSGPEKERHSFNAIVSQKDLWETYLPHFEASIREAGAYSIMGAYNRTLNEPCCASKLLLKDILREKWQFKGYVVSDCGAIHDIHAHHKITKSPEESAALAVKMGCDLDCGYTYRSLRKAIKKKLISEEEIDVSVKRLFLARFKLGMFDPPEMVPYAQIPFSKNDCEEHRAFALEVSRKSLVLLKNRGDILPIRQLSGKILITGPNADSLDSLLGNYNGDPSKYTTPLAGFKLAFSPDSILYEKGCDYFSFKESEFAKIEDRIKNESVEFIVACMGISPKHEGEERLVGTSDRSDISLPSAQESFLKRLKQLGKPIILVLLNGSPISSEWAHDNMDAILEAWYPGQDGGLAIAEAIIGKYSPAGRLPITFVRKTEDLPDFKDYNMKGRTYRYMEKEPLYPFGYGLSYSRFEYSNLRISSSKISFSDQLELEVDIKNTGLMDSDEVVQIYISHEDCPFLIPRYQLIAFKRVHIKKQELQSIKFDINSDRFHVVDETGNRVFVKGMATLYFGGAQPDPRSEKLMGQKVLNVKIEKL